MSKTQAATPSAAPTVNAEPVAAPIMVTIHEFCTRLSETVKTTELISAFAATERAAGNHRDTAEKFQARYAEFINKPV